MPRARVLASVHSWVPSLLNLNPESCYLSFSMELETQAGRDEIEGAFSFVADDCELDVVAPETPEQKMARAIEDMPGTPRLGDMLVFPYVYPPLWAVLSAPLTAILSPAFLTANNIAPSEITLVPAQFDPTPLANGEVDGWFSFVTNEPNDLGLKGFKVTTMLLADTGYPLVSETYVVKTDTTAEIRPVTLGQRHQLRHVRQRHRAPRPSREVVEPDPREDLVDHRALRPRPQLDSAQLVDRPRPALVQQA